MTASTEPSGWPECRLTDADLAAALRLSASVGWNQTAADWRLMLRLGEATGIRCADGQLVATALTLPFGPVFGWISMVIVDRRHRGTGLAKRLLRRCVDRLSAEGRIPGLDAAPAGRPLYLKLGFRDVWSMQRLEGDGDTGRPAVAVPPGLRLRPIEAGDWPALAAYDRAVFGGERLQLLQDLAARLPAAALLAETGREVRGLVLARPGRLATQIGPLEADGPELAGALAEAALRSISGLVFIDVPDRHLALKRWLEEAGFRPQRPFTRMYHDRTEPFDDTARLFAAAGPELA